MELEMSTQSPDSALPEEPPLPLVNISVTADIIFTHCHASVFSDDNKDPKVAVITSPYSILEEQNNETDIYKKSKSEYLPVAQTIFSEEYDQPIVRQSKKSTQLNCNAQDKNYIENKRNKISRTVVLPYFGCSKKGDIRKTFYKNTILFKSSKSWEKFTKSSNSVKKEALFRSKSLTKTPTIKAVQQYSDNEVLGNLLQYPFSKSKPLTLNYNIRKHPTMRSFYHVEDLKSGSQILFDDETRIRYLCTPIINSFQNPYTNSSNVVYSKYNNTKNDLFREEMLKLTMPHKSSLKSTRNVSILHRPRTRNQTTSTTSLSILNNNDQGLEDSIKGLLKPYIAAEKAFPSELILKLVPKKEALEKNNIHEDATTKDDHKLKSAESSDIDLLAPMLTAPPKQKKRKGSRLFSCFSKSKKKKVDDTSSISGSDENLSKEVYYPSAVEVYHNK